MKGIDRKIPGQEKGRVFIIPRDDGSANSEKGREMGM